MFDDIYDNGDYLLGKNRNVIDYIHNQILNEEIDDETAYEILDDLGNIDYQAIVVINYNHPMGYSIECFTYDDIVNKP
jgi:hypothetical protein